jgi:hypothetical protein
MGYKNSSWRNNRLPYSFGMNINTGRPVDGIGAMASKTGLSTQKERWGSDRWVGMICRLRKSRDGLRTMLMSTRFRYQRNIGDWVHSSLRSCFSTLISQITNNKMIFRYLKLNSRTTHLRKIDCLIAQTTTYNVSLVLNDPGYTLVYTMTLYSGWKDNSKHSVD